MLRAARQVSLYNKAIRSTARAGDFNALDCTLDRHHLKLSVRQLSEKVFNAELELQLEKFVSSWSERELVYEFTIDLNFQQGKIQ